MKMKFYIVPHSTMTYGILLGRDFLTNPSVHVTMGETVKIVSVEEATAITPIMHIEYNDNACDTRDELRINTAIGQTKIEKIRETYETCYLENLRTENCMPDFEMVIALKHDQLISLRPRRLSFADKTAL